MNIDNSTSDLQLRLARKIVLQIHEGSMGFGEHLRELDLSKEFGVSRTPIRAALNFLTGLGLIEKRTNRGFFVVAEKTDCLPFLQDLPKTDDEQIKETIAKDWFNGEINKEVSEGEIRNRYALGRLTAQRILNSLSEEGVVSRMPGYGWQFEPTLNSARAHDESYDLRLIIEPGAISSTHFIYDISGGAALRERHEKVLNASEVDLRPGELFRLDADFHSFIAACSRNRFIIQSVSQQNRLRRLLEYYSLINAGRLRGSCMEHLEILDFLDAKENDMAAKSMKAHLEKGKRAGPDFQLRECN